MKSILPAGAVALAMAYGGPALAQPAGAPSAQPKDAPAAQPKDAPGAQPKDAPGAQPKDAPAAQPNAIAARPETAIRSTAVPLTEAEVVNLAVRNNPDLTGAVLTEKQSAYAVEAEEGRYPLVLSANAGYTRRGSVALNPDGSKTSSGTNTIVIGSELRKDFATGTLVSLSVQGQGSGPSHAGSSGVDTASGADYTFSTRLSASQPLLRGAWTRIGESGLRIARLEQNAAKQGRERVTSEVVRDSLLAYWELWYAGQALWIQRSSRELAATELSEARQRSAQGALSPVDALSFETRVASLDEAITEAEVTELTRTLDLAQVLGVEAPQTRWRASGSPPEDAPVPSVKEVEAKLAKQSPDLQELVAKVDVAEERVEVAGDAYRPRLDIEGYLDVSGSGSGSAGAALSNLGTSGALGGYVGVIFEAPLTGRREAIEVESARIGKRLVESQLGAAQSRLNLTASRLVSQLVAAKARRAAAEPTVAISMKLLEAERSRYGLGASTPIAVQQAEDDVRSARLRVSRARVDVAQALIALDHAEGELAAKYPNAAAATGAGSGSGPTP